MTKKGNLRVLALAGVLSIAAAACGGGGGSPGPSGSASGGATPGGTYRTAIEDFGFTGAFDPTGEYLGSAFGIYSNMLIRTLMGYKHILGLPGDVLVPDLAASMPTVSSDRLTYSFTLRSGIKFGPPVNRVVTSKDVAYAFQRIDSKAEIAQYGFYYDGTIVGMNGPVNKPADKISISGITTPDDTHITFHLQKPTGDFLYRLSMPATGPIPAEVAGCFPTAGGYGRDVVSSGPYMIKGADKVNDKSCSAIKPMSGFDPTKEMLLVRNPTYVQSTDPYRSNYLDGMDVVIDTNTSDIFDKVTAGQLDGSLASNPPPQTLQSYLTDPNLKSRLHADPGDRTWYITMNLLTPPFDDINVRKAVNYAIDKAALIQAIGGPTFGSVATHVFPPTVLDFKGETFDPYATPGEAGDLAKAKAEMAKATEYDTNGDGKCDVSACNNVLYLNRSSDPYPKYEPTITQDLAAIGIKLKVQELDTSTCYTTLNTMSKLIPISSCAGWGKDYADPYTFAVLFQSVGASCQGQVNYSEVGLTASQAASCGPQVKAAFNAAHQSPTSYSLDSEINKCYPLTGSARQGCWIQLDKDVMNNVVPWVPYRWGNNVTVIASTVTKYQYDQFSGTPSWSQIAVNNGINPNTL